MRKKAYPANNCDETIKTMATAQTNWKNLGTIVSLAILVGTEVLGVALAAGWALGGIFDLGQTITIAMMVVFAACGVFGMVAFIRNAITVEPIKG
ncbi:MAG: hypothetical protein ACRDBH_02035 [Bosea sp. (in: a-proteobacteria)]